MVLRRRTPMIDEYVVVSQEYVGAGSGASTGGGGITPTPSPCPPIASASSGETRPARVFVRELTVRSSWGYSPVDGQRAVPEEIGSPVVAAGPRAPVLPAHRGHPHRTGHHAHAPGDTTVVMMREFFTGVDNFRFKQRGCRYHRPVEPGSREENRALPVCRCSP